MLNVCLAVLAIKLAVFMMSLADFIAFCLYSYVQSISSSQGMETLLHGLFLTGIVRCPP